MSRKNPFGDVSDKSSGEWLGFCKFFLPLEVKTVRNDGFEDDTCRTAQADRDCRRLGAFREIPALERDLALEKLRTLYDRALYGGGIPSESPVAETEPAAASCPIDLGAVLSLDPTDEAVFEPGPDAVSGPAFDAEAEPAEPFSEPDTTVAADSAGAFAGGNPDTETPGMAEPAVSDSEPELEGESGFEPDPEAASEAAFGRRIEPAAESGPVAASESDAVPEPSAKPVAAPESEAVSEPSAKPVAAPGPAAAAEPVVVPEPAPARAPEAAPAEKPQYIAPTLFGLEEETVRHRHKQRVIMSLYDTPAPAEKPARPETAERPAERPEPAARPEPAVTLEPAARHEPAVTPDRLSVPELPRLPNRLLRFCVRRPGAAVRNVRAAVRNVRAAVRGGARHRFGSACRRRAGRRPNPERGRLRSLSGPCWAR